jgi:hypothetical protein
VRFAPWPSDALPPLSGSLRLSVLVFGLAAALLPGATVRAQPATGAARDSSSRTPVSGAQPAAPSFAFSGVLYANYQYGGPRSNRAQNRFDIDRAYLNFRARPGDRDSIRVTADIFQQRDTTRDAYYRGWAFRAKYAFFQHEFLRGGNDNFRINARLGLVPTVVVEKEESIWPRGLGQVAIEQNGFFASSDAGIASTVTLPSGFGEIYATIVNGTNYTSRELDRFKDFAARLTITPLAKSSGFFKALQLSPWYSLGQRASDFAVRRGTVLAVAEGLARDRYGLLVSLRDPRWTFGIHVARRNDVIESADTTVDVRPTAVERTGSVVSLHTIVRPLALGSGPATSPFWLVFRVDQSKPVASAPGYQRLWVAGASVDVNPRTSLTLDLQSGYPQNGLTGSNTKVVFLHLIANF